MPSSIRNDPHGRRRVFPFGFSKRFQAKWIPVRVKKARQKKNLEPGSDSIRTEEAPGELSIRFRKGSVNRGFSVSRAITKLRFLAYQHCSEAGAGLGISNKYMI
jgi:hypothetical protein